MKYLMTAKYKQDGGGGLIRTMVSITGVCELEKAFKIHLLPWKK